MYTKKELNIINRLERENKNNALTGKHYVEYDFEKYNAFVNGHYFLLNRDEDYGFAPAENQVTRSIESYMDLSYHANIEIEIDRDSVNEWKKYCKANHYKLPYVVEFASGERVGFNPQYMLDLIDFCGNNIVTIDPDKKNFQRGKEMGSYHSGIFCFSEDKSKMGMILPVQCGVSTHVNYNWPYDILSSLITVRGNNYVCA